MRAPRTFALEIQRGGDHEPSRVSVVLSTVAPEADGVALPAAGRECAAFAIASKTA